MNSVFVFHNNVYNIEKDEFLKSLYYSVFPEDTDQNLTNPPSKCFQVKKEYLQIFIDYVMYNWKNVKLEINNIKSNL